MPVLFLINLVVRVARCLVSVTGFQRIAFAIWRL